MRHFAAENAAGLAPVVLGGTLEIAGRLLPDILRR
jgi:hypothetical protein